MKVTLALSDATMVTMPRWRAAARDDIVEWQRQRATTRTYSRAWKQLNRQIARRHAKVARRADNWARDTANRPDQATFACTGCGYEANADVNAAANVAQLGQAAEQAWEKAGRPSLKRPKPRMRRGITDKPKVAAAA